MTTTIDTILGRASAARLGSPAPTRAQLEIILSAGLNAPDHGRLRPWRYVVLQGDGLDLLGRAMSELKQRQTPEASAEVLDAVRMKARRAPVIVVAAAHLVKGHRKVPEIEQIIAVGAAVENMVLAAHSLGIGTMWKTGDPAYDSQVKQVLGLDLNGTAKDGEHLAAGPAEESEGPAGGEGTPADAEAPAEVAVEETAPPAEEAKAEETPTVEETSS